MILVLNSLELLKFLFLQFFPPHEFHFKLTRHQTLLQYLLLPLRFFPSAKRIFWSNKKSEKCLTPQMSILAHPRFKNLAQAPINQDKTFQFLVAQPIHQKDF